MDAAARPAADDDAAAGAVAIVFANLKGNLGDFAILHAMLAEAKAAFPGHALNVYSHPLHGVDGRRMAAFTARAPDFDYRGPTHGSAFGEWTMRALKLRLAPGGLGAAIRRRAKAWSDHFAGFRSYAAVLVAGGEQWSGRQLGGVMFPTLCAIRDLGVKVFAFPFSVKPSLIRLHSPAGLKQLFAKLSAPLLTRDEASAVRLRGAGVTAEVAADGVFSLAGEAAAVSPAPERDPSGILLALTGDQDEILSAAGRLLAEGFAVEALTTCENEDAATLKALRDLYGIETHAPATWQDVVAEFKASRLVVTNRLHGLILGVLADAPLLPVANRTKVRSFVDIAALDRHADDFGDLTGPLAQAALDETGTILARMRAYHVRSKALRRSPLSPAPTAVTADNENDRTTVTGRSPHDSRSIAIGGEHQNG